MLTIGKGPGPKNVLVECDDGSKLVVAYRTWKYKYAPTTTRSNQLAKKTDAQFRTVVGIVEFDPRESTTKSGSDIRNITVSQTGFKENAIKVGATLWPSHEHVAVEKGDVVVLRGKFERNNGTNASGESVTYNNLSVSSILVLGSMDEGVREDSDEAPTPAATADDDDIPF
jgi:hypothetical protein